MCLKELLKSMLHAYFIITTGITMAMYLSCLLLYPDTTLTPADIGGILLIALITDLSFLLFYSRKILGKMQMLIRFCIHIPVVLIIVLYFCHLWDWINIDQPKEVAVFIFLILGIYALVVAITFYRDKKTANQLNEGLKKYYRS